MAYCSIHGAEDFPGCSECEENPRERLAREDVERAKNAQAAAKSGTVPEVATDQPPIPLDNHPAPGSEPEEAEEKPKARTRG